MKEVKSVIWVCIFGIIISSTPSKEEQVDTVQNLVAFSKLYGYVRYFHPSDEAASIDWDAFAIYGARRVMMASNKDELKQTLEELFTPIAPTIKIEDEWKDFRHVEYECPAHCDTIRWQHKGNGFGSVLGYYQSIRTGRENIIAPERGSVYAFLPMPADQLRGKTVKFQAYIKNEHERCKSYGLFWPNYNSKRLGFQYPVEKKMFLNEEWEKYSVAVKIPNDITEVGIDLGLSSLGKVWYDSISVFAREGSGWEQVYQQDFESLDAESEFKDLSMIPWWYGKYNQEPLYRDLIVEGHKPEEGKVLLIESEEVADRTIDSLFEELSNDVDTIVQKIGSGLKVQLPMTLLGDSLTTYPKPERTLYNSLKDSLRIYSLSDIEENVSVECGNLINVWNVFQHFYPYFDYLNIDWEDFLRKALTESIYATGKKDFASTLRMMLSGLQDGHIIVSRFANYENRFYPPMRLSYVEDSLIVDKIFADTLEIQAGDIITRINGEDAQSFFDEERKFYSFSNRERTNLKAARSMFHFALNKNLVLELKRGNHRYTAILPCIIEEEVALNKYAEGYPDKKVEEVAPGVIYVNLTNVSYHDFLSQIDYLNSAKVVIFDLRGYPKSSIHEMLPHLMNTTDTTSDWLRIPKVIYPDHQFSGFIDRGWHLKPKNPKLKTVNYFLINEEALSYAESIIGYVEHYKLGKLIGRPTAGINGNINWITLPGDYRIRWTGSRVVRHDGSQMFAVGFDPDVHVERTIKGVREGRDEILEKAIELAHEEVR